MTLSTSDGRHPVTGGVVTWACYAGFPPSTIFPFTPPERIGTRNLGEFQVMMYRPLYWLGKDGQPEVDFDRSLGEPPQWSDDGRTVTVTIKPWRWSNGETVCADNVMFWVNMMAVKGPRYGCYSPGYFPDNLESYEKVADNQVRFTFDRAYSRTWVLMNQLSLITPMPKAWDRTATGPANASADPADIPAVYDYLAVMNGEFTTESNEHRETWADSPVWSVVNGPWRLKSYAIDGTVTFVPNEHYCGPNKPRLDEFRQVPMDTDEDMYHMLEAGPDRPGGIQIGYLPFGYGTKRIVDGVNPVGDAYDLIRQDTLVIRYAPFNFDNPSVAPFFRQTYLRQALQLCLDQDRAIREFFHGQAHRTNGPVPMMPDSKYVSATQRANPMAFDLDRARELLADNGWDTSTTPAVCVRPGTGPGCAGAGIKAGDTLTFSLRYADARPALAWMMHQWASDAAAVGIELCPEAVHGSTLIGQDHTEGNPRQWEINCWNGGWAFYGHLTGEMIFKTGGGSNWGHYSDRKADELIDRTVTTDDIDALHEYQDYLAEQVPVVFTPGFPLRLWEVAKNLRGIEPVNPYGLINPEDWYYVEG